MHANTRHVPLRPSTLLAASVLAIAVLRSLVAANIGLTDDEAYYRLWSLSPALSYFDHPPMVAWFMAMGRGIAGDTAFGIRCVSIAAFVIGAAALWRTSALLFNSRIAETASWFMLAMPLMALGGIIITPDTPSVLFTGLVVWSLAELQRSKNPMWWLAVSVFAGLGLLSKYTNLFVGASIVLWLIGVPSARAWFRSWQLWAGGLIAAVIASPVVIWNAQNDWASFGKQFGRVARGHEFTAAYALEMIGGFLGLASPIIAVLALVGLYAVTKSALTRRGPAHTLVAATLVPALAYFLMHALHARVQANWLAPLYPSFAICAALAAHVLISRQWSRSVRLGGIALGCLITSLIYVHAFHPLSIAQLRRDPTDQMRGWAELASAVDRIRIENHASWVSTSSYATTGQLAFALKGRTEVHQLNERQRYLNLPRPSDSLLASPAIYVELKRRERPELLQERFQAVRKLGDFKRPTGVSSFESYAVYLISKPVGEVLRR